MLLGALLLEDLAEAAERRARRLPDYDLRVLEPVLDQRPHAVEVRLDEERASLDNDTERHDGALAQVGVRRRRERADLLKQGREDLRRREARRERVDDAERGTRRRVVFDVSRFRLGADREQGGDDRAGEVELLDLALLEADEEEKRVQAHDAEVVVVREVTGRPQQELDQARDVRSDDGAFLRVETSSVPCLRTSRENVESDAQKG